MSYDLQNKLVVAISSRALFDLEHENKIYDEEGLEVYKNYQVKHENEVLYPGTAMW